MLLDKGLVARLKCILVNRKRGNCLSLSKGLTVAVCLHHVVYISCSDLNIPFVLAEKERDFYRNFQ